MAIQTVTSATQTTQQTQEAKTTQEVLESEETQQTTASEEAASSTAAVYEKTNSTVYTPSDVDKLNLMLEESNLKAANFQKLMESIINKQSTTYYQAFPQDINTFSGGLKDYISSLSVDEATIQQAQEDVSEDGYYGVDQTTERIMDFAKAIAGDDLDKIAEMREAVEKGFENAESIWGDTLPEISQKTYEAVMSAFDEWESSAAEAQSADASVDGSAAASTQSVAAVSSKK